MVISPGYPPAVWRFVSEKENCFSETKGTYTLERQSRVAMSTGTSTEGGESEYECSVCGESKDSPQALGGHMSKHSETYDREPEDLHSASDEAAQSIIDRLDFNQKDGDSLQTAAAKALLDEGDTEGYSSAFGECDHQDCDWGANGFEADYCIQHPSDSSQTGEDDSSEDEDNGSDSTENSTTSGAETSRAEYVAELIEAGLSVTDAEKAAEVRF